MVKKAAPMWINPIMSMNRNIPRKDRKVVLEKWFNRDYNFDVYTFRGIEESYTNPVYISNN